MDWHLTWQDPVAVALVVLCVAFAAWLRRRLGRTTACARCPAPAAARPSPGPAARQRLPLEQLRIGSYRSGR